jgi:iron(III) transport system permease protein
MRDLYEAADSLGTTERVFFTITLPGARYGLISACMVVFTMACRVRRAEGIGGNTSAGGRHLQAGDRPAELRDGSRWWAGAAAAGRGRFIVDHLMQRKQQALLTARSVPHQARALAARRLLLVVVVMISALLLLVVGMAAFGSVVKFWPYNLSLTLNHYTYGFEEAGIEHAYRNSLVMALWCGALGATITFAGAYWLEKRAARTPCG